MSAPTKTTEAPVELRVLAHWEELVPWLLEHTNRWPKSLRFTLCGRVQNHVLDVAEMLVQARYEPALRADLLHETNLRLERLRHLFRFARALNCTGSRGFERALAGIDATGRMIHGWRQSVPGGKR